MEKKTIIERAIEMREQALEIKKLYPLITNIWFTITDCEVEEMRELATDDYKLNFVRQLQCASMQVQHLLPKMGYEDGLSITVFVHSKPLEFKTHTVEEYAYINH